MNTLPGNDCCNTCDDVTPVAVPGPSGAAGTNGTNGTNGVNAYTTLTAAFVMPAEAGTVTASVGNSTWMATGQELYVATAGYMRVSSVPTSNTVVLINLENTVASQYLANVAPGSNIPSGSKVAPAGIQGPSGSLSGAAGGDLEGTYPNPTIGVTTTKGDIIVNNNNAVAPRNTRLAAGANGTVMHSDSTTATGLAHRGVDLTGVNTTLTGAMAIANGGTGNTTALAAFNALSPVTTRGDIITRGAANNERLAIGAANTVFVSNGTDPSWGNIGPLHLTAALARVTPDYILVREEQASGVAGGGFTSAAWRTRALNTETVDTGSHASVAASQVTLAAGTYRFRGEAVAYRVDTHKVRLRNVTDAIEYLGTNARSMSTDDQMNSSVVSGRFTIATAKVFELQHQCQTTKATDGMGLAASFGTEVYATVEFWREAQ